MKKHVLAALKATGLPLTTAVTGGGGGLLRIEVGSRYVIASSTPKNPHTAAIRIARDLRRAVAQKQQFTSS